jgi:hypothetical protein
VRHSSASSGFSSELSPQPGCGFALGRYTRSKADGPTFDMSIGTQPGYGYFKITDPINIQTRE